MPFVDSGDQMQMAPRSLGDSANHYPDIPQISHSPHPLEQVMEDLMFPGWKSARTKQDHLEGVLNDHDLLLSGDWTDV